MLADHVPATSFTPRMSYRILYALKMALALLLSSAGVSAAAATWEMPPLDRVINYRPHQSLQIFTADGVEICAIRSGAAAVSAHRSDARTATGRCDIGGRFAFREHGGIDPKGMARALLSMLSGGRRQGASTITQQVARTFS